MYTTVLIHCICPHASYMYDPRCNKVHVLFCSVLLALPIGRAQPILGPSGVHPFVRSYVRPSIRQSIRQYTFSSYRISSETTGQIFFETCPSCSPSGLVVSGQRWFRSVDQYVRRRQSLTNMAAGSHL